jgi:hypothetical protein
MTCLLSEPYNCSHYKHFVDSFETVKKYGLLPTNLLNTAGKYFTVSNEYDSKIELAQGVREISSIA